MSGGPYENPKETAGEDEAARPEPADPAEGVDDGVRGAPGDEGHETDVEEPQT